MNLQKNILILLAICLALVIFPNVEAKQGCCSYHEGVDCAAGSQSNGKVICNDGWLGSSCLYSEMVKCEGYSTPVISCEETFVGEPFCKDLTIYQTYQYSNCQIGDKIISTCIGNEVCIEGKCEIKTVAETQVINEAAYSPKEIEIIQDTLETEEVIIETPIQQEINLEETKIEDEVHTEPQLVIENTAQETSTFPGPIDVLKMLIKWIF